MTPNNSAEQDQLHIADFLLSMDITDLAQKLWEHNGTEIIEADTLCNTLKKRKPLNYIIPITILVTLGIATILFLIPIKNIQIFGIDLLPLYAFLICPGLVGIAFYMEKQVFQGYQAAKSSCRERFITNFIKEHGAASIEELHAKFGKFFHKK